jgi:hypothetical protein
MITAYMAWLEGKSTVKVRSFASDIFYHETVE